MRQGKERRRGKGLEREEIRREGKADVKKGEVVR